ncbi:chemotaxis protein CheW [uncultured Massilia sp.]|uniref:chemotaxis protein CheW n=1 Tax=uncultured Massilia sp. TaxID=169973 RepID=UPI0025F8222E|nr:chemotaxis protein CheW [uncultured Massilia sp.]
MKQEHMDTGAPAQYLTFMLGGEAFGIGIMAVKEIIEFGSITEVPMMPPSIRGVINLRGAVVPVMDLAARFGRPPAVPGKRTCIVIVELEADGERQVTGVVVDAVSAVLDIPAAEIEPAPSFGTRIRGDFISGMGKLNGKFVILLDVRQVLALDGLPELAAAADAVA